MELSKRLFMTASMVKAGSIVADVGCDHGYTAIYLVQNGICPRVLAMDVNEGPLLRAGEHIQEAGLSSYIETRLSDGLSAMKWTEEEAGPDSGAGCGRRPEADTLLMAGIGGRLTARILEDAAQKLSRMRAVILQPQSEVWLVRRTLSRLGYRITAEDMVKEDGRFYTAMRAENLRMTKGKAVPLEGAALPKGETAPEEAASRAEMEIPAAPEGLFPDERTWRKAGERYGFLLIKARHPVLREYLQEVLKKNRAARAAILAGARSGKSPSEPGDISECIPEHIPERSRERLEHLEEESALAGKLALWMENGADG